MCFSISFILTISGIVLPQQQKIMLTLHITMPSLAYTTMWKVHGHWYKLVSTSAWMGMHIYKWLFHGWSRAIFPMMKMSRWVLYPHKPICTTQNTWSQFEPLKTVDTNPSKINHNVARDMFMHKKKLKPTTHRIRTKSNLHNETCVWFFPYSWS